MKTCTDRFAIIAAWSLDFHKLAIGFIDGSVRIMDSEEEQVATREFISIRDQWMDPNVLKNVKLLKRTFDEIENIMGNKKLSEQSQSSIIESLKAKIEILEMELRIKNEELEYTRKTGGNECDFYMEKIRQLEKTHRDEIVKLNASMISSERYEALRESKKKQGLKFLSEMSESEKTFTNFMQDMNQAIILIHNEIQRAFSYAHQHLLNMQVISQHHVWLTSQNVDNPESNRQHFLWGQTMRESSHNKLVNDELVRSMQFISTTVENLLKRQSNAEVQSRLEKYEKLSKVNIEEKIEPYKKTLEILQHRHPESVAIRSAREQITNFDAKNYIHMINKERQNIMEGKMTLCDPVLEFPAKEFKIFYDYCTEDFTFVREKEAEVFHHLSMEVGETEIPDASKSTSTLNTNEKVLRIKSTTMGACEASTSSRNQIEPLERQEDEESGSRFMEILETWQKAQMNVSKIVLDPVHTTEIEMNAGSEQLSFTNQETVAESRDDLTDNHE